MSARRLAPVALAAGLAACQVNEDPAEGGFISGVTNLSTGAYEERIDEREAELGSLEGEQSALELRAAEIRRQQAELDAEIDSAEGQLAVAGRHDELDVASAAKLDQGVGEIRRLAARDQHRLIGLEQCGVVRRDVSGDHRSSAPVGHLSEGANQQDLGGGAEDQDVHVRGRA